MNRKNSTVRIAAALAFGILLPFGAAAQVAQGSPTQGTPQAAGPHAGHGQNAGAPQQTTPAQQTGTDTGNGTDIHHDTDMRVGLGTAGNQQTGSMPGMSMGPMQGGKPPPDARDPNAYAEGTRSAGMKGMDMADDASFGRLLVNSLEWAHGNDEHGQNVDAEAWYGGDYDKAWLKAEGDRRDGRLDSMRTEVLWDHAIAPYWGTQIGVRLDTGGGSRNWLAFGVQGLAPYWFETEATGYWGDGGTFAARVDVKYELLFTQRLVLQPEFAANVYSRENRAFGNGAGLSDLRLDLRLRYEVRRQFAPYIGVSWHRKVGGAARLAEQQGKDRQTVEAVAGVRLWF
jgi:copper resistance protein B